MVGSSYELEEDEYPRLRVEKYDELDICHSDRYNTKTYYAR